MLNPFFVARYIEIGSRFVERSFGLSFVAQILSVKEMERSVQRRDLPVADSLCDGMKLLLCDGLGAFTE